MVIKSKSAAAAVTAAGIVFMIIAAVNIGKVLSPGESSYHTAAITSDGAEIRRIDLRTAPDETFTVRSADGGYNTVTVKNGSISVTAASCPDKVCVNHGELRTEQLPIVCVPNRLVITLVPD